jgi:hypothetical protein
VVPPPKYHITSLLPAHIAAEAPIANVFLMERGEPIQERVALEAAVDQLIENTDDAYGFPPFSSLAPHFVIDGSNYEQLRVRERQLLTRALANVTIWRLRVRGHEWGELLPRLILGDNADGEGDSDGRIGGGRREPVGIHVETQDREPVGIPIEPAENPALAFDRGYSFSPASTPASGAGYGTYADAYSAETYSADSAYASRPFSDGPGDSRGRQSDESRAS